MELLLGLFLSGQWSKECPGMQCYIIPVMLHNLMFAFEAISFHQHGICQYLWLLVQSDFWSSHIQTYIHTYIQKAMHKSPPCIRTGGLKKNEEDSHTWFTSSTWHARWPAAWRCTTFIHQFLSIRTRRDWLCNQQPLNTAIIYSFTEPPPTRESVLWVIHMNIIQH